MIILVTDTANLFAKDPFQARYRYERSGAEFIQALPGPADTAVGSRIYLHEVWR